MKTSLLKESMFLSEEKLKEYLKYASTDEARAVLFVKKQIKESAGHWIDIIDCVSYQNDNPNDLEFKLVICGHYKRILKPKYPPKSNFIFNGKLNEKEYYLSVRAITWETAHKDISQQKSKGIKGVMFEIKGVKYNKNRGKFIKDPPWLNSPAWKNVDIHSLRGADRSYVQQFLAPPDWRYEIKSIRKLSN
ncbi:hypothetical protein [Desulfopila sp. IMCC35006]|uniref:hypothetical protein n=1 Tax=Desulfopila sp. IMCC35006 TaxID=2569542 RepID=UPI00197A8307|nr:hypothetical protein [Desulfopila sp. IMCC35006]